MTHPHWPMARGSHRALATQFGTDRADLMQWVLTTGDPLADPVAARIAEDDQALANALDRGLRNGLATLDEPDRELAA